MVRIVKIITEKSNNFPGPPNIKEKLAAGSKVSPIRLASSITLFFFFLHECIVSGRTFDLNC